MQSFIFLFGVVRSLLARHHESDYMWAVQSIMFFFFTLIDAYGTQHISTLAGMYCSRSTRQQVKLAPCRTRGVSSRDIHAMSYNIFTADAPP